MGLTQKKPTALFIVFELALCNSIIHGCTLENPRPDPIHGRVIYEGETYKCWYTGPTHVSCTGGCGPVMAVSTIHNPLDLDSLHSVCSCCGSTVNLVTEAIFRCEFRDDAGFLTELKDTLEINGTYFSFENCECSPETTKRKKREFSPKRYLFGNETQKGHFCRRVKNTKFENQCQAQKDVGVEVCYSKTRWAIPEENLTAISAVMKQKMRTEESGIYRLNRSIELIAEPYRPSNPFRFPAEIFKPSECDTSGSSVVTTTQRTVLLFFTCIVTLFLLL